MGSPNRTIRAGIPLESVCRLLDSGSRRRFLADDPKLLPQGVLFGRQRHELFVPEPGPLGKRSHCMHNGYLALRDVVDLAHQIDDLRHILPGLRVVFAAQTLKVHYRPMAVSLFSGSIEIGELLELLIVFFFERLHLCIRRDIVVHTREADVFDSGNLCTEFPQIRLRSRISAAMASSLRSSIASAAATLITARNTMAAATITYFGGLQFFRTLGTVAASLLAQIHSSSFRRLCWFWQVSSGFSAPLLSRSIALRTISSAIL